MHKYFMQFAEAELQLTHSLVDTFKEQLIFSQIICLPFFNESLDFLDSLAQAAKKFATTETVKPRLLILNINKPEGSEYCAKNTTAIKYIHNRQAYWQNQHPPYLPHPRLMPGILCCHSHTAVLPDMHF